MHECNVVASKYYCNDEIAFTVTINYGEKIYGKPQTIVIDGVRITSTLSEITYTDTRKTSGADDGLSHTYTYTLAVNSDAVSMWMIIRYLQGSDLKDRADNKLSTQYTFNQTYNDIALDVTEPEIDREFTVVTSAASGFECVKDGSSPAQTIVECGVIQPGYTPVLDVVFDYSTTYDDGDDFAGLQKYIMYEYALDSDNPNTIRNTVTRDSSTAPTNN